MRRNILNCPFPVQHDFPNTYYHHKAGPQGFCVFFFNFLNQFVKFKLIQVLRTRESFNVFFVPFILSLLGKFKVPAEQKNVVLSTLKAKENHIGSFLSNIKWDITLLTLTNCFTCTNSWNVSALEVASAMQPVSIHVKMCKFQRFVLVSLLLSHS